MHILTSDVRLRSCWLIVDETQRRKQDLHIPCHIWTHRTWKSSCASLKWLHLFANCWVKATLPLVLMGGRKGISHWNCLLPEPSCATCIHPCKCALWLMSLRGWLCWNWATAQHRTLWWGKSPRSLSRLEWPAWRAVGRRLLTLAQAPEHPLSG